MKVSASRPPARETISGGHHSVPSFYKTAAVLAPVLPSRCARCGAVSRDFLCAACLDFLVADRPMWLNPGLLPGPSLLDLTGGNEVAIVGADLSEVEWHKPAREPAATEAVRLVRLLGIDSDRSAIVSVGDAEVLHAFLREARRNTPRNVEERRALAALDELEDLELPEDDVSLPTAPLVPPEPVPRPEPPLPLPQPGPGPVPEPEPEPGPEPEETSVVDWQQAELEESRRALEKERADAEAFVRSRTQDLVSKEELLFARERSVASKEEEVEARARAATERLIALEKDSARREVLRFLGGIPRMSAAQADVVATAFPDITSLTAADEKALTQCKGVTDALARATYERANLLFGLGRLSVAVDALRDALRLEPSKSRDVVPKAEQLRRDGHPSEAIRLFQAVLEITPDDPRAILGLGDAFIDLGDADAAEAQFTRALGKDPQNAPILFRKGELLERKGRWGAAVQYHNRAIALRWNYPDPWLAKGEILLNHARPTEALECFEKVASFEPRRIEAFAGEARARAALGQRGEAEAALAKAIGLAADHPTVRAASEAVARMTGPVAEVAEPTERITDLPSLAKAFAAIEEDVEPPVSSVPSDFQSFVESIEPEKEDTHVLLQLAELAIEGGDPQMGLLRYEQAIERDPRNADAWTGKGVAFEQLERFRDALEAYDRALFLKPNHELARKWRETCARHIPSETNE